MANLDPESAPFIPKEAPSFDITFTTHPSLASFNMPFEKYITNRLHTTPTPKYTYRYIAVGALVFSHHAGTSLDAKDTQNAALEPRILLLRRSPLDSMPLLWEIPGGAADPEDPSILYACARELHEEAGLLVTSINSIVGPEGRLFLTGTGNVVCKFEFVVSVQGQGKGDGCRRAPEVTLDAKEHVEYLWATEGECRERRAGEGDQVVELVFTDEEQRESVLEGFRLMREVKVRNGIELEVSSAL